MVQERAIAELLGIPDDVTQVCLLAIGYATSTNFRPAARPPIEEIVYHDRWGNRAG